MLQNAAKGCTDGGIMQRLERLDAALLFDLYGELLTGRQQRTWQLYWLDDWSLAEVAEDEGISRAAVYDLLGRTQRLLLDFEDKLGLVRAFKVKQEALADLREALLSVPEHFEGWGRAWQAYLRVAKEEGLSDV
jgi:hypothetical protein